MTAPLRTSKVSHLSGAAPREATPSDVLSILRRRAVLIAGVTLVTVALAIAWLTSLTPRYVSTAQILLGEQGLSSRSTFDLLEAQALTNAVIEGELAILRSGALLVRVSERLDLSNTPEFNEDLRTPDDSFSVVAGLEGIARTLIGTLSGPDTAPDGDAASDASTRIADAAAAGETSLRDNDAIVGRLRQMIDVRQLGSSFVVQVSVGSEDPVMAAAITNTLMEEYIGFLTDKRFQAAQRFTNWLEVRVAELAVKLEESEQAALAFRSVMEADADSRERLDQQMRELTSKVVNARVDLALATAQANLTATIAEESGPLAAADILSSEEILRYRTDLGDLRREAANAAISFGEGSLQTTSIERAVEKVEASISLEVTRAIDELLNRAEVSDSVVQTLEGALSELESLVLARSADEIELNQLQRIADANRRVYEEFLGRFKETSEIQNLQSADAEIISYASPSSDAAYPRKKLGVVLAGAGGLFGGLALAFLMELIPGRVGTSADLSRTSGLAIYGNVPKLPRRGEMTPLLQALDRRPDGPLALSARRLLSNADMRLGDQARSVAISGVGPGATKSGVSLMLGWAAIRSGRSCIVVDADVRAARLSQGLRLARGTDPATLVDVLYHTSSLQNAIETVQPTGLHVLPCRPTASEPSLLLETASARGMVEELLGLYDMVIFDLPPVRDPSDVVILPVRFDIGLFVAEAGRTRFDDIEAGLDPFGKMDLSHTGAVLTNVPSSEA